LREIGYVYVTGSDARKGQAELALVSDRRNLRGEISMANTVRLHRVLATKPEKVYRAFIEADALAKWLPPNGFACTVHQLNTKVGGTFRMSFRNFTTGNNHSFGGEYIELVPHERLRYTDKFDDPNLPGRIQVTVTLKKVSLGTELNIVQEGLPDAIPLEACYLGWQESLRNLAKLVEPEINQ
jgi:uncharacterized protein YndB with AHSA1/START domain